MTSPAQLIASLVRRASGRTHRRQRAAELEEELAFHVEQIERDLLARGISDRDAHDAALRQIGNRTRIQEGSWDVLSFGPIESAIRQMRLALRSARRSLGYSVTVVATLALGIGATVTIFSVLDHVLLRPLPYTKSDRLVALYQRGSEGNERVVSYPTLLEFAPGQQLGPQAKHRPVG